MSWDAVDLATYWSAYQSFQIHGDQVDPELKLEGSIGNALEQLNSGEMTRPVGYCIVYSEASQAFYVLYRGDSKMAAFERFGKKEASIPSRLSAAKAVAKQKYALLPLAVLIYRFMEFNAQVILLTFLTWFVRPELLSVLFVLLWYLPAAKHTGSFGTPIGYPLLNFVVDDFSFLSLHPTPRNASRMYLLAIIRVCLLLLLMLLLFTLPEQARTVIAHTSVFDSVLYNRITSGEVHGIGILIGRCWTALYWVVLVSTFLWLCVTMHMFLVHRCGGRPSPILGVRDDVMLFKVEELANKVEVASQMEPAACREELKRLQQEEPSLQLANVLSIFGPAWAILLHIGMDICNIYHFITVQDYSRAALLALAIVITVCYMANSTRHGLRSLYRECKLSWDRGMFTEDYLVFVRADKGIQSIPALIIVMSGLPFKANGLKKTVGGIGSIAINLALVVPFIMQEFDLGIEREGFDQDDQEPMDSPRSTITEMRGSASSITEMSNSTVVVAAAGSSPAHLGTGAASAGAAAPMLEA